jgi:hypothetical protein
MISLVWRGEGSDQKESCPSVEGQYLDILPPHSALDTHCADLEDLRLLHEVI